MSWLLPSPKILSSLRGRVTTVIGEEADAKAKAKREGKKRRQRRWYYSEAGKRWRQNYRAKRRQWEQNNAPKLHENHKRWREENRERFNLYQRLYYATSEKRREYLREKCREYRKRLKAEKLSTQNTRNPLTD